MMHYWESLMAVLDPPKALKFSRESSSLKTSSWGLGLAPSILTLPDPQYFIEGGEL